jgi:hypothetical protein
LRSKFFNPKTTKMKKVLFVLAVAGVMASCGDKKKSDKPAEVKDSITTTTTTTTPPGVPAFADAEVQAFVNDYTVFVQSYLDACKAKDMAKAQELSMKMNDWSSRSMAIGNKLAGNPDETKKFNDYMSKLTQDWANAAKSMMPSN